MDRERLFEKLDIDSPEDFRFFESFEALLEEEEHIEEDHIHEILKAADMELIAEHIDHFFDSLASSVPEDESELSIIVDIFRNNITSAASADMSDEAIHGLASWLYRFRKWYSMDHNAVNENSGEEISVRDARYEILAAKLLGEDVSIDFGRALVSGPDSYEVRIKDII